jgi:hypothetical protein
MNMAAPSRETALDHVVVVMFENRSFDNLLGRLYEPGEVASFEGVIGKHLSNPVPDWAEHRPSDGIVRYGIAPDMNTPNPDPGEEWMHADEFRATSLLATMRGHWNLGAPFSGREATARSFADIFTLETPRASEDWPDIIARPMPRMPDSLVALDAPLGLLGKTLLSSVLSMAQMFGKPVPAIDPNATMTGSEAIAIGHEVLGEIFPAMRD